MEKILSRYKTPLTVVLVALTISTMVAGILLKHYYLVLLFNVWLSVEMLLWRFPVVVRPWFRRLNKARISSRFKAAQKWLKEDSDEADRRVLDWISETRVESELSEFESRYLSALGDLVRLRTLFGSLEGSSLNPLHRAFVYSVQKQNVGEWAELECDSNRILDAAMSVSRSYLRLFEIARGRYPGLAVFAQQLYSGLFGVPFEIEDARKRIDFLSDCVQRDGGIPFLILNLIRQGALLPARRLGQWLLTEEVPMDEDLRSVIYWMAELNYFVTEKAGVTDYESTIRYLYHLCFTNPDRAGFLEIDSQFFSQFETVTQLAQEGFMFRETLIEKILSLWREHDGLFDSFFQSMMEHTTNQKLKIYDNRQSWEMFWTREVDNFCRDYLYVLEGNFSFAAGRFEDAELFYERALKINPELRSASLNLLFCYAKRKEVESHEKLVERLLQGRLWFPNVLHVIGDSYILIGNLGRADEFYHELKGQPGWDRKADYYRSTFCFEQGLFEEALKSARVAFELNPTDSSVRYHLSLCYSAVGEKDKALDMIGQAQEGPQWLNYYRFTLQRDLGSSDAASETLRTIPTDYFEDPDELEEAVEFAKSRQDLNLLRHLKRK